MNADDMIWERASLTDSRCRELADRHYSRVTVGGEMFIPPGKRVVLYCETAQGRAVFGTTWRYNSLHDFGEAWMCSIFRNETGLKGSLLIKQAVAATHYAWRHDLPPDGFLTFVDARKVRPKATPGHVFIMAGFRPVGRTRSRDLIALRLPVAKFPPPVPARGENDLLFW